MDSSCFLLLQTSSRHSVLGISPTESDTEVLVTLQGSGAQVHEIYDQKCLYSWSQKERRLWTVPAVEVARHNNPPTFFGVLDERFLCVWKREDSIVDQSPKEFTEPIANVLGDPLLHNKIIIVMRNANIRMASLDLVSVSSSLSPPDADESSYVEWTHLLPATTSGALFLLVLHSNTKKLEGKIEVHYHLNVYSITPWHDHPAEKKKRKREEATPSGGNVTVVAPVHQEQRLSWRVSHALTLPENHSAGPDHYILACAFDNTSLSVALLWSNGVLHALRFPTIHSLLGEEDLPYRTLHATSLAAYNMPRKVREQKEDERRNKAAPTTLDIVAGVMGSFVVLAGKKNSRQNTLSASAEVVVTVWDMAYGTLQGTVNLVLEEEEGKKAVQISADEPVVAVAVNKTGWVAVGTRNHVAVATIGLGEAGLASCLNKMSLTAPLLLGNPLQPPISIAPPLLDCVLPLETGERTDAIAYVEGSSADWLKTMESKSSHEDKIIQLLVDANKTKTLEDFQKHFNDYLAKRKKSQRVERAKLKKSKGKKKSAKLEAELSQNFVCRVGARCLTSGFWNVLRYFVLNGQLMTTLLPDYASILIENKQIDLIKLSLARCDDLSEKSLSQFLSFFLKVKDDAVLLDYVNRLDTYTIAKEKAIRAKKANKRGQRESGGIALLESQGNITDTHEAAKKFLNLILARPVNDSFMQLYLRELPFAEVLALLRHLHGWLHFHFHRELKPWSKVEHHIYWGVPSLAKVIQWVDMVLDSHVTELVMMEESHETVKAVRDLVKEQVALYEGMDNFMGYVSHFLAHMRRFQKRQKKEGKKRKGEEGEPEQAGQTLLKGKMKQKKKVEVPDYSIEVLRLEESL